MMKNYALSRGRLSGASRARRHPRRRVPHGRRSHVRRRTAGAATGEWIVRSHSEYHFVMSIRPEVYADETVASFERPALSGIQRRHRRHCPVPPRLLWLLADRSVSILTLDSEPVLPQLTKRAPPTSPFVIRRRLCAGSTATSARSEAIRYGKTATIRL